MRHVDEGTLHALLDGALRAEEPERAREVEAHLETCTDCRARLDQAAEVRDRAADVLGMLEAGTEPAPAPDFQEVLARGQATAGDAAQGAGDDAGRAAAAGGHAPGRLRRQATWTHGLAWAATVVVALGTGYLVRDLAGPTGEVPGRRLLERTTPAGADTVERLIAPMPLGAAESAAAPEGREAARDAGQAEPTTAEPARSDRAVDVGQAADEAAPPPAAFRQAEEMDAADRATAELEAGGVERPGRSEAGGALPAAEHLPDAVEVQKLTATVPPVVWVEADLAEAESRAGPILVLPDAEIAATEVPQGDEPLARTLQVLPGGVEIRVVQGPGPSAAAGAVMDADAAAAQAPIEPAPLRAREEPALARVQAPLVSGPDSAVADADGTRTVTLERDGLVLTLSGPLPAELLQALARAARPRSQ